MRMKLIKFSPLKRWGALALLPCISLTTVWAQPNDAGAILQKLNEIYKLNQVAPQLEMFE